jgi:hypothetical protein
MKVLESVMEEMTRFGALHLNVEDAVLRETSRWQWSSQKFSSCYAKLDAPNKLKFVLIFQRTNVFGTIAKS